MEEEINKNEKQNQSINNEGKNKSKPIVIILIILVIILILAAGVYFAYKSGLFKTEKLIEQELGQEIVHEVEPEVQKTFNLKKGGYFLITEETEKYKDGGEVRIPLNIEEGEIEDSEEPLELVYKVVLIDKGLYTIEFLQNVSSTIFLDEYDGRDLKNNSNQKEIDYKTEDYLMFEPDFKIDNKVPFQVPITEKITIMTLQGGEDEQSDFAKFSLLNKKITDKSLKTGTRIELKENKYMDDFYEIGKNIPEGIYDLVLEEGEFADVTLCNPFEVEWKQDRIFKYELKNRDGIKKTMLYDLNLKKGQKLSLTPIFKTKKREERLRNVPKFVLIAKNQLQEPFVPIEVEKLENTATGTGKVLKIFDLKPGKYQINDDIKGLNYTKLNIPKGVYNVELTSGIYAKFSIIDYAANMALDYGDHFEIFENQKDDTIIFQNTENLKNTIYKEKYFEKGMALVILEEGMPKELKGKTNNINIRISQIDKTALDVVSNKTGKSYEIKENLKNEPTIVGKDIPVGIYDAQCVPDDIPGSTGLMQIKDKNGNLKQEVVFKAKKRILIKDIILTEGDSITIKGEVSSDYFYSPRNEVTLKLTSN